MVSNTDVPSVDVPQCDLKKLRPTNDEVIEKVFITLSEEGHTTAQLHKKAPNMKLSSGPPEEKLTDKTLTAQEYAEILTMAQMEFDKLYRDNHTPLLDRAVVTTALSMKWPNVQRQELEEIAMKADRVRSNARAQEIAVSPSIAVPTISNLQASASSSRPANSTLSSGIAAADFDISTTRGLEAWVHSMWLKDGFRPDGTSRSTKWFKEHLIKQAPPGKKGPIRQTVNRLKTPGQEYSLPNLGEISKKPKAKLQTDINLPHSYASTKLGLDGDTELGSLPPDPVQNTCKVPSENRTPMPAFPPPANYIPSSINVGASSEENGGPKVDLLHRKLIQLSKSDVSKSKGKEKAKHPPVHFDSGVETPSLGNRKGCFKLKDQWSIQENYYIDMDMLLPDDSDEEGGKDDTTSMHTEIRYAPLVSQTFNPQGNKDLLPQYGLLGTHNKEKLFLNTNMPFSAFICGTQGSGKSHTISCILENALIPSSSLGRLESPLSTLVFSYGHFGGDGSGFSISEAAFLATPSPVMSGHPTVKLVNVFVSPSNYSRISKLYSRLPNVTVTMFRLKPWTLDIGIMLTLMNAGDSKKEEPLYMVRVKQILRTMAISGLPFDYVEFKRRLKDCKFNKAQITMLQTRLDILDSFLDMDGSCPELQFNPGEITIMDMSCPFVDANTACILFRIGLQQYLQSSAQGKMIILDEAHKYMLNNPGSESFNDILLQTIRLQRHYGARVIISTQEPTMLTDLMALCSIIVIHRFSSPKWFAAIKQHIPIPSDDEHSLLQMIESLKTGMGMVYSPNAVLGREDNGALINGTGKLFKIKVRKRVTSDGGVSLLAV